MRHVPFRGPSRGRVSAEILIVLGLGLGQSAVYSIVALLDLLTRETALAQQTVTLNPTVSSREWLDLTYQLLGIGFSLMPVALVCWLLWRAERPHLGRLGLGFDRPARDLGWGAIVAVGVGVVGIGVYLAGRALGITVAVNPAGLAEHWWTVPVLLLSALRSGLQEEVVMIGYLFARLRELGWRTWPIIVLSALIRGSYHLYQGWGSFAGNVLMGLVFGWMFTRTRGWLGRAFGDRTWPFVIAHFLLDAVIFVGYPFAAAWWPGLLG